MSGNTETVSLKWMGADAKEVVVEVPAAVIAEAVKATHMPTERFESDMKRRVDGVIKNGGWRKPEELLDDQEFVGKVAEKHGYVPKGTAGNDAEAAKNLREAIGRAVADVEVKRIKPLEESLKAKTEREEQLLVRDLQRQIVQAAAENGVKKSLLRPVGKGKPAGIVALLMDSYELDDETGEWYLSDGKDGFVLSQSADAGTTYMSPAEHVAAWTADPANADYVDRTGQSGAGHQSATKGRQGTGMVTLSPQEASDANTYNEALKKVGGDHSKIRIAAQAQI